MIEFTYFSPTNFIHYHDREELQHPELIKAALNYGLPLDIAPFEVHLGQFSEFKSGFKVNTNYFEYINNIRKS